MQLKVYIEFKFNSVKGGGNSFLTRLQKKFQEMGVLSTSKDADIILYNSHHCVEEISYMKGLYPHKIFIHRIDGPIRMYNNEDDKRDDIVISANKYANGTVFQSKWSMEANKTKYHELNYNPSCFIHNGCDIEESKGFKNDKTILIASSVSTNMNKGFDIYKYLDDNLDFNKYEFWFAGNSPINFKNIKKIGVCKFDELIQVYKRGDIYITASKNDPCSNSLVEALSNGLPCVALNSGGHPEIVKDSGCLFEDASSAIDAINKVDENWDVYKKNIDVLSLDEIAYLYLDFFEKIMKGKYEK